jgi:hypothetical protein
MYRPLQGNIAGTGSCSYGVLQHLHAEKADKRTEGDEIKESQNWFNLRQPHLPTAGCSPTPV